MEQGSGLHPEAKEHGYTILLRKDVEWEQESNLPQLITTDKTKRT